LEILGQAGQLFDARRGDHSRAAAGSLLDAPGVGFARSQNGRGELQFLVPLPVNDSVNAMCPVVVDDLIFISAAYYKIGSVLLRVKPDGKSVEEVWRGTALELHWTTPIYLDGYLYACSGRNEPDARMRCVELRTGKLMWDVDESWPAHSTRTPGVYGRGSSILADGKLITLGEGGLLGIVQAQPGQAGRDLPFSSAATALSLLGRAGALAQKALPAQRRSSGLPGPGQVAWRRSSPGMRQSGTDGVMRSLCRRAFWW
jgi:hypothetical protein